MAKPERTEYEKQAILYSLAYNQFNMRKTARETGCPLSTIKRWNDSLDEETQNDLTARVKEDLLPKLSRVLDKAMARLESEMGEIPRHILPTTCGILFDKVQLLTGRPTLIEGTMSADASSLAAELDSILGAAPKHEAECIDTAPVCTKTNVR